jgi:hypothetical protein
VAEKKAAPASAKAERVEIGFGGGQVIAIRVQPKSLTDLRKAAEKGGGWHSVETDDGEVSVNLAELVFIRVASPEHRVGFSN